MKKELTKHIFKSDRCEVAVFAETEEQARLQLSHAKEYRHLRVETVPLINAGFAQGLLDALNEGAAKWTAEPISDEHPDTWFSFRRVDGLAFWCHSQSSLSSKGIILGPRVEFRYDVLRDSKNRVPTVWRGSVRVATPSITCSTKKSGEQLAKDIVRRLLPDCEEVQALYVEQIRVDEAAYVRQGEAQRVAEDLSEVFGLRFSANGPTVKISGYVSPSVAEQIHSLLNLNG